MTEPTNQIQLNNNQKEFDGKFDQLTPRQRQVLKYYLSGKEDREISTLLECGDDNVRHHIANACKVLGLRSDSDDRTHMRVDLIHLFVDYKPDWVCDERRRKIRDLPRFQPEYPEGQVPLDSPFYVERQPTESSCFEAIELPNGLIRIRAPKWMGKTSLLSRILNHADQKGYRIVQLDLSSVDPAILSDLDRLLRWFCSRVCRQLDLKNQVNESWDTDLMSSTSNCTDYFEEHILPAIKTPIALGIDEIDRVFPHRETADGFLGMLRSWHESGKNTPLWRSLRLVIAHATEVFIPLNINQSPFNVGLPIELPEFTPSQVLNLARLHGLHWTKQEVADLQAMIGGHPQLVRLALYQISKKQIPLAQLLKEAPTTTGIYRDHLRRCLDIVQGDINLVDIFRQIVTSNTAILVDPMQLYRLQSVGLIAQQGNRVRPRCELYRVYFRQFL